MELKKMKHSLPTKEWKQRMLEGDDIFNQANIEATNIALLRFIDSLLAIKDLGEEKIIIEAVKDVVLNLNELNDEFDYFIETMEREELYEFIMEAAQIAGLNTSEDITEEWREW
jgi:hypothetical protein